MKFIGGVHHCFSQACDFTHYFGLSPLRLSVCLIQIMQAHNQQKVKIHVCAGSQFFQRTNSSQPRKASCTVRTLESYSCTLRSCVEIWGTILILQYRHGFCLVCGQAARSQLWKVFDWTRGDTMVPRVGKPGGMSIIGIPTVPIHALKNRWSRQTPKNFHEPLKHTLLV